MDNILTDNEIRISDVIGLILIYKYANAQRDSCWSRVTVNPKFSRGFYFRETSHSFVKIKPSRNGEITFLFIDIGKS